jgi:pimeloyl-ACP methyl ester carboxylesterase
LGRGQANESNVALVTDTPARPVRRVQAGQVRLAFRVWHATPAPGARPGGAAATPPVVLLHALGEDSSDWERVAPELTPSWRVYAPDLRGHGASDWSGPYTVEQLTADLAAFLDALGLRRVALVGHSMGAVPAYLFAARHPERVTRLILEEPAPPFPRPPAARERPAEPPSFDWDATALSDEFTDPPPSWGAALSDIKSPALLIAGGQDSHLDDGRLAEMAALMGDCELTAIEAGHMVHATRPAEFTEAVTAFLSKSLS